MSVHVVYELFLHRPNAHRFKVRMRVTGLSGSALTVDLPAWIPGSYMIRDFARNLSTVEACNERGALVVKPLDKQTWLIEGKAEGPLVLEYEVYAWDHSVRAAQFDQEHAFFNGTSLFLRVRGAEGRPCDLILHPPAPGAVWGEWSVATTLPPVSVDERGFGLYRAQGYDHLIDSPVEIGCLDAIGFRAGGVPHQVVWNRGIGFDQARLKADLERICSAHVRLFGELPVSRYLFLLRIVGDGYGGLEHAESSALMCSRKALPQPGVEKVSDEYRGLLGLFSHEYFHLWNVKRIRPQALAESDLLQEAYTRDLWVFEGITSYYDDLMLVRSGVIDVEGYLELLARNITRFLRTPGRFRQSLAESSHYAWTRFYKQDEDAPNAIVSYYLKGALVALGLDVVLRMRSRDRVSLDDLMRLLWREHGRGGRPLEEGGLLRLAERLLGAPLDDFFEMAVEGTDELPLEEWLRALGVEMRLRRAFDEDDLGGLWREDGSNAPSRAWLGARWRSVAGGVELTHVIDGGPAQEAGLSAGDRLVAVNGLKADADNLGVLLSWWPDQPWLEIHAFREDRLRRFRLPLQPPPEDTCELRVMDSGQIQPEVRGRREVWLSQ